MDFEKAEQQRKEEIERVKNFSFSDLINDLEDGLTATDIIVAGYQFAEKFTDGMSIIFAGLCKSRAAIENALIWLESNVKEDEDDNDDNSL